MAEFSEAAKEQRRAYKRAWSARNRERIKEYQRAYWERKAQASEEVNENEHTGISEKP